MRLQYRPGYALHRAFHKTLVHFQVWRNNRSASEAFRDPEACDVIYRRRSTPRTRALRALAIAGIAAGAALAWHHRKTGSWEIRLPRAAPAPLADARSIPDVPSSPVEAPKAASRPPGPKVALGSLAPAPVPAAAPAAPSVPERFPAGANVLLACKKDRTLYAYSRGAAGWTRIAAFPMAIGRNSGDKGERGDARTPEGRFWITGMVPGKSKGPLYGALVLPLNYPRPSDRAEGKGGDGIWIHGVPAGTVPNYTHGCISLANEDMLALGSLADAGTPIVILPDSLGPDPARQIDAVGLDREFPAIFSAYGRKTAADTAARDAALKAARAYVADERKQFPELGMQSLTEADRKAILARLEKWRTDWANREVEAYASNYDASFRDRQGRSKTEFLERKSRIFASKTRIEMEIRDPKIESECYGRARVSFRQDYLAEGPDGSQRSSDNKTLRLDQGPQGWLIITE